MRNLVRATPKIYPDTRVPERPRTIRTQPDTRTGSKISPNLSGQVDRVPKTSEKPQRIIKKLPKNSQSLYEPNRPTGEHIESVMIDINDNYKPNVPNHESRVLSFHMQILIKTETEIQLFGIAINCTRK